MVRTAKSSKSSSVEKIKTNPTTSAPAASVSSTAKATASATSTTSTASVGKTAKNPSTAKKAEKSTTAKLTEKSADVKTKSTKKSTTTKSATSDLKPAPTFTESIDKSAPKHRSARGKHPMPAILRVICSLLFLLIIAIFLTWFLLWCTNLCNDADTWEFINEKPMLAFYNYLVIFGLLALLSALTWRPFFSTGLLFATLSIISFAHMQKFEVRGEPLLPEEFALVENAGDLMKFVDMNDVYRLAFGVIFVMVGAILAEYYIRKLIGRSTKQLPWWDKTALIPRTTFSLIALTFLACVCNPVLQRRNLDWIEDIKLVAWNQTENYANNGFLIGFIYNLGNVTMQEPANYSEETMLSIADEYRAKKAEDDKNRMSLEEIDNIIIVLSETSYDPALYEEIYSHTGGDVTPNLHQIFRQYPSGYMYSPEYGGSTANVEFEVQTGLTNYWTQTFPYVNILSKLDNVYSAGNWSKNFGYNTTGLHSYGGSFYKRNIVYPKMGYDTFLDEEDMHYTDREYSSQVINDDSLYREVLDLLKADDRQMIFAITMQNHAGYDQAKYPELEFKQRNIYGENWALEASYQSLHEADKYLGKFIEALDNLDEKTVVLWFGDHAMGMLDLYNKSDDKEKYDLSHLTPYFVYANFELQNTDKLTNNLKQLGFNINNVRGINLPTTSPNCLQNTMYNVVNLQKPAFYYLLDSVCSTNPVLAHAYLAGESPVQNTALRQYELVNYDMLIGKHYWDGN